MGQVLSRQMVSIYVVLLVAGALCVPVAAQEAPADVQNEGETTISNLPVTVEEIIVTAQKRKQDVQEVPISVSTLAGEDLEAITVGAPDVRALSARVPSLVLESSFGRAFPRFYIRGLGNTDFDLNASQPVSMIVDEVVLENAVVKGMPLFDLQQVEVLRGPQGTLFGRNTPAGIVKFDTVKPSQEFDANFRASYGTFNTIDINGGVGGPLSDTVSMRFSGLYQSRSDWITNAHTGEKNLGGYDTTAYRLQFLWEPNDKFSGLFNFHGWDVDGTARVFRANILQEGSSSLVSDFSQDTVYHDGKNKQEISSYGGVMKLEYDFGAATFTSVTGYETMDMYSRGDIDGGFGAVFAPPMGPGFIPFPSESADGIPSLDQLTQEFRLTSNSSGRLDWLVGFFYFNEDMQADTYSYNTLAGNVQDGFAFQNQETKAWALFATINYAASDRWDLQAGLRYSNDEKEFSAERPWPTFNTPTVQPILESTSDSFTSWDLAATYKVNPKFNLYGRLATGFRAPSIQGRILFCADFEGGTNPATNCVTTADTEKILSGEIGMKTILADNRLRFNLNAYIFELDGQQLTAVGGEYNTATLLNVDKTQGYGFETDIEYIPTANWMMTFGFSYNPTKIKDKNLTVAPCGGGCTITNPVNEDGNVLIDGNSLPHAPDVIFNGIINFSSDPSSKGFFGTLDWAYHSEKHFFLYESEEFKSDSFELGLRLGYGWNLGMYEVALYGRNIADAEIVRNGIDFNNLTGMTNDPRTIGVEFIARF